MPQQVPQKVSLNFTYTTGETQANMTDDFYVFQVTYNGTGTPNATSVWTQFGLTFNGTCESAQLTSYGQHGALGRGSGNIMTQLTTATAG